MDISILDQFPPFLRSADLVAVGLFRSVADLNNAHAKKDGAAPPRINIGKRKYRYTKEAIIQWINKNNPQTSAQ